MDLLGGAKRFGSGLLDFAQALGGQRFAPDPSPLDGELGALAPVLNKQYDRAFRAARGQAIRNGAGWGEMNDIAALTANAEHEDAMVRAVQMADALKQRRLQEGRTKAIHDYVQQSTDLSAQQKEALLAMDEGAATKLIAEQLFPDPDRNRYSQTAIGDGYVSVIDGQTGEQKIIRDPTYKGDSSQRQLSLMRSEEGEDIVFRNPLTGEELNRVAGGASRKYKPTEGQYKAAGYAARMVSSSKQIDPSYVPGVKEYAAFTRIGKEGSTFTEASLKAALNKAAMSPAARKYFQSVSNWARAKLRHESGAVIALEEIITDLNTFFPIPGDDPGVIAQKAIARAENNETMKMASGDAWELWTKEHAGYEDSGLSAAERAAKLRGK